MRLALAFIVFAVGGPAFAAGDETPTDVAPADPAEAPPLPEFPTDPSFEPNYKIEGIEVRGNQKTKTALIVREVGVGVGDVVSANDARVGLARLRLLALGFFLDVHLSLV